jgi:hypothetical protein
MKKCVHESDREFLKKEVQMTNKYMKKYSNFLAIKEMKIKTKLKFHLTPVRIEFYSAVRKNEAMWFKGK